MPLLARLYLGPLHLAISRTEYIYISIVLLLAAASAEAGTWGTKTIIERRWYDVRICMKERS